MTKQDEQAEQYCLSLIRIGDYERYLSLLFAPKDKRGALAALYAFNLEIARIRDAIKEPLAGEIRLRWWRDQIENNDIEKADNLILKALFKAQSQYHLPKTAFLRMCDARIFDLYNDPILTQTDLEGYLGETASTIIQLACLILDEEAAQKSADASGHAGVAQGINGLIRLLPLYGARGQLYIPADMLAAAGIDEKKLYGNDANIEMQQRIVEALCALSKEHYTKFLQQQDTLPTTLRPAFLSAALTPAYLQKTKKIGANTFDHVVAISPLKRWWLMMRCALSGKF